MSPADPPAPEGALILLVDDFEDALEIYQVFLTFKGYRVVTARTGAEAIQIARTHHPQVILMDIRMPRVTGTEAMLVLRADPDFEHVPIIAFTAHALDDERKGALRAGFNEVITKPCLPDELAEAIDRLLADSHRRCVAPPADPS